MAKETFDKNKENNELADQVRKYKAIYEKNAIEPDADAREIAFGLFYDLCTRVGKLPSEVEYYNAIWLAVDHSDAPDKEELEEFVDKLFSLFTKYIDDADEKANEEADEEGFELQ